MTVVVGNWLPEQMVVVVLVEIVVVARLWTFVLLVLPLSYVVVLAVVAPSPVFVSHVGHVVVELPEFVVVVAAALIVAFDMQRAAVAFAQQMIVVSGPMMDEK